MPRPRVPPLVGLVTLALAVRLAALGVRGPSAIEWDGAIFARVAENLRAGLGDVSLLDVPNVLHAPLYSLFLAGMLSVVHDPQRAGIAVSLIAGVAALVPVFLLTRFLYGSRAATVAGVLVAVYPLLVNASIQVLSEQLFITLATGGLAALCYGLERRSPRVLAGAGLLFGLTYVTREEGLAYVMIALGAVVVFGIVERPPRVRGVVRDAVAVIVPFAVCALPYIVFLSTATGHVSWEAKSGYNYLLASRMERGMSSDEATAGIGPDLSDFGVSWVGRTRIRACRSWSPH